MKPYGRLIAALLIVAVALILPAASTSSLTEGPDIKVAKSDDSVAGLYTTTVNALFATGEIQTAVDNANPGDTIYLRAKKYYDNVDVNKDLSIIGRGIGYTVVDGQKLGSVFTIDPGVTALLSDMTIKNGQASNGGGILNYGTLTLRRCELTGNTAEGSWGGGVFTTGTDDSLTVDSCYIHHNHAGYGGGGISTAGDSTLVVRNSQISFNTADVWGGAMDIYGQGLRTTLINSRFIGNSAPSGGAIYTTSGAEATVDRCTFMLNRAVGSGAGTPLPGHGGAVYDYGTMTITNSVFTNNFASIDGGAIFVDPSGTLTETGNYFASNTPNDISP